MAVQETQAGMRLLTTSDLSRIFNVHQQTIRRWVEAEILPPPRRFGRHFRWPEAEIKQLIFNESNHQEN